MSIIKLYTNMAAAGGGERTLIDEIKEDDINVFFMTSTRGKNDSYNEKRERIIESIVNGTIDKSFISNERWKCVIEQTLSVFRKFAPEGTETINVKRKGGRKYNFDFEATYRMSNGTTQRKKFEFKYGIEQVCQAPQFCSPSNPDQFLSISFKEYFYDNHLDKIISALKSAECDCDIIKPLREDYCKHVGSSEFMKSWQIEYSKGSSRSSKYTDKASDILRYQTIKKISEEAIREFMKISDLLVDRLSADLISKQSDKIYIMWKNAKYTTQSIADIENEYRIEEVIKKTHNTFHVKTKSGRILKILLRWKNGNGIAWPAFQIK